MIPEYDILYSLKREAQERAAAASSVHARIRDIHLTMADRYADRAWGARERRCSAGDRC